jgi:hypothetical protein
MHSSSQAAGRLHAADLEVIGMGKGEFVKQFEAAVVAVRMRELDTTSDVVIALLARRLREIGRTTDGTADQFLVALTRDRQVMELIDVSPELLTRVKPLFPGLPSTLRRRFAYEARRPERAKGSGSAYDAIVAKHVGDGMAVRHDAQSVAVARLVSPPSGLPVTRRGWQRRSSRLSALTGVQQPAGKGRRHGAKGKKTKGRIQMLLADFQNQSIEDRERFVFDERAGASFRRDFGDRHDVSLRTVNRDWASALPALVGAAGGELGPLLRARDTGDPVAIRRERERLARLRRRLGLANQEGDGSI